MDQFLENDPVFNESLGLDETFKWNEGSENVDFNKINNEIASGIAVEVDCEKRTVEKIKQYGLEFVVGIEEYIQKSNAYVLFYLWMKKNRSWYKIGFEPYNVKSVYSKMPKTFEIDYTTMTQEVSEAFEYFCFRIGLEQGKTEAEKFFNYYESNGWKVGKNPMKNWKASANTWIIKFNENAKGIKNNQRKLNKHEIEELRQYNYVHSTSYGEGDFDRICRGKNEEPKLYHI